MCSISRRQTIIYKRATAEEVMCCAWPVLFEDRVTVHVELLAISKHVMRLVITKEKSEDCTHSSQRMG
jgi:hypothetical protein